MDLDSTCKGLHFNQHWNILSKYREQRAKELYLASGDHVLRYLLHDTPVLIFADNTGCDGAVSVLKSVKTVPLQI